MYQYYANFLRCINNHHNPDFKSWLYKCILSIVLTTCLVAIPRTSFWRPVSMFFISFEICAWFWPPWGCCCCWSVLSFDWTSFMNILQENIESTCMLPWQLLKCIYRFVYTIMHVHVHYVSPTWCLWDFSALQPARSRAGRLRGAWSRQLKPEVAPHSAQKPASRDVHVNKPTAK